MYLKNLIFILLAIGVVACSSSAKNSKTTDRGIIKKQLYLPDTIYMIPDGNDFNNAESDFCYDRMIETDNLALFWHKEYGQNPMENADTARRFDPETAVKECERFYNYYVNDLKMVEKGHSLTDTFKLIIIVFGGDEGTAFGGGESEKVGIVWTPAVRINKKPYGALAHEMAHSFQYLSSIDAGAGPRGPIMEMSAQYLLWQVYPEWMTLENYHLDAYLKKTNFAFLHPTNMYHSPYVLEFWAEKHGKEFFGKLSRETQKDEDPVATYKRLNQLSQEQFNAEMFEASQKFMTWDLKRVQKEAYQYANIHKTSLHDAGNGWFVIDSAKCPQNYGYNGIQLEVPESGTEVIVNFKGMAGVNGFSNTNIDKAGWRYGFVASLKDSSRVYGNMHNDAEGEARFNVPENTEYLWLVVMGAPTEHWPIEFRWGPPQPDDPKEEQWPYKIKIKGTFIEDSVIVKV